MSSPHRILSMLKGRERFVLRYAVGMELAALQQIIALARNPVVDFDWFDAAVLSYQLGEQRLRPAECGPLGDRPPVGLCGTGVPPVNPPLGPPWAGREGEWVFDEPAGEAPPCV